VSISSPNEHIIRHGDVLSCSSGRHSSVIYQWLITDMKSRVALVNIGQHVTVDLCRLIDNNLIVLGLPRTEDDNATFVSVTCSTIVYVSGRELIAAQRTNFTVAVSDDVSEMCRLNTVLGEFNSLQDNGYGIFLKSSSYFTNVNS